MDRETELIRWAESLEIQGKLAAEYGLEKLARADFEKAERLRQQAEEVRKAKVPG